MVDRLDELGRKLDNGEPFTYEDAADLFTLTMIGSATMIHNGLSRDDIIALLKTKFPTEAELTTRVAAMRRAFKSSSH